MLGTLSPIHLSLRKGYPTGSDGLEALHSYLVAGGWRLGVGVDAIG